MHRTPGEVVVALVPGQPEVIEVGLQPLPAVPIAVPDDREESIRRCALPITAPVGIDVRVEELAYVPVDGLRLSNWIVVVPEGSNEVRLPALNHLRHLLGGMIAGSVI